jgi:beta-N-acetylhexosaminidase
MEGRTRRRATDRRRRLIAQRRRRALGLVGVVALVIGIVVGAGRDNVGEQKAELPEQCKGSKPKDLRRIAGMKLVVRWDGAPNAGLEQRIRNGEVGGVIVFPPAGGLDPADLGAAAHQLQRSAARVGQPPVPVMIDQEGGAVKRFPEGPPSVGAPAMKTSAKAREEGLATGKYLGHAGINVDLAPVLDVAAPGSALADRSFGSQPSEVTNLGLAFVHGLESGGVAATAKHFPGLGRSTLNTDTSPSRVDASKAELQMDLEPFAAAAEAGVPLVMAGLAAYPALGIDEPAALSSRAIEVLLRKRLGYDGVVITDDLGAQAVASSSAAPEAALRAAAAGSDLLLFALNPDPPVLDALVKAAGTKRLPLTPLRESCARITALRESLEPAVASG